MSAVLLAVLIGGCAQAVAPSAAPSNRSAPAGRRDQAPALIAPTMAPVVSALPRSAPLWVSIPAIGASAPVIQLGLTASGALQVPTSVAVTGWYRLGPTPGELGAAVIVGHVDSAAAGPGVFFRLRSLRAGDEVIVRRADGSAPVFVVDHLVEVAKTAFPTAAVYGATSDAELRLITCGGAFDPATGHYLDNIIAFAHLRA